MTQRQIEIDLSGLTDAEYAAIESEATRLGVSFEDALKQILLNISRKLQKQAQKPAATRLFGFSRAH